MVDQFSKWVDTHALSDIAAEQMAKCAVDHFFSRCGSPLQIHTDYGENFDGNVMKALCALYLITKTHSTPYCHCSNGQVKHYNFIFHQLICCYLLGKDKAWDQYLQLLGSAICSMEHRSTGYRYNIMMFGMEVFKPVDILFCTETYKFRDENPTGYV